MQNQNQERRNAPTSLINFGKVLTTLKRYRTLWAAPTIVFTLLGLIAAIGKSNSWKADQALIVRDELVGELGSGTMGRFDSLDTLKRSSETILQVAKNGEVVAAALREIYPKKATRKSWPSLRDVEDLQDEIEVSAPKGTEFGASEVIYLSVKDKDPERAKKLATAVCDHMETRLNQLRDQHARSVVAELKQRKMLADAALRSATEELSKLEEQLGSDLGEMRSLAETGVSGESILRTQMTQIKLEIRQAEKEHESHDELRTLLKNAGASAKTIVALPSRLLEFQPALQQLRDGLVEAQLRTARLRGGLTQSHPRVQAAEENEVNILRRLQRELANAMRNIDSDILVSKNLAESLRAKLRKVQARLDSLAGMRATYSNLVVSVEQRQQQVRDATAALADAEARQQAATASSLISRVDGPVTGSRPTGPGRTTILLGSMIGGLAIGLSLVYLLAPWQDGAGRGRRKADKMGRRATDRPMLTTDRRAQDRPLSVLPPAIDDELDYLTLNEALKILPPAVDAASSGSAKDAADVESDLAHLSQIAKRQ